MSWRHRVSNILRKAADSLMAENNPASDPARNGGKASDSMTVGATKVPENVEQSMHEQGMQTGGPFAPGRPLTQFFPWGSEPRQWDYPVGYNIASRPRASAAKVSFETLKAFLESYDVARICIEHRQDEIRALDWSIVPDDGVEEDVSDLIKRARKFFERPDGFTPFDSWQQAFLEDVLAFDAGAIYRHRTRKGELGALEIVDGTTIAPLIDYWGRIPDPPAPAFVQFIQGIPAVWLRKDELIYQPFRATPRSPYGLPPLEWLLLTINTDIRWQWHFLMYFTEGSVPDTFMEAPPDLSSPQQIMEFQELWDAVMTGDQAQKHKVKWIPAGAKPIPAKNQNWDVTFPTFLLKKVCAAFKLTPAEIGFTDDVNRATADSQENTLYRAAIKPLVRYLEGIYTRILQEDLGMPLRFKFDLGGEKEDREAEAKAHEIYIRMGVESVDEVRKNVLGLEVDPKNPVPRFVMTSQGPIPVDMIGPVAVHNTKDDARIQDDGKEDVGSDNGEGDGELIEAAQLKKAAEDERGDEQGGEEDELWPEEPLPPEVAEQLREPPKIGSRYVWIALGTRKAALKTSTDDLTTIILEFFEQEAKKLAKIIGRQPEVPSPDQIEQAVRKAIREYDWTPWSKLLRPQLQEKIEQAFEDGARDMWEAIRRQSISLTWDLIAPKAVEFAEKRAAALIGKHVDPDGTVREAIDERMRIDEGTRDMIRRDLTRWLQQGLGWKDIADRIEERQYTGFFPDWRARRIARTEAAFAYNHGNLTVFEAADISHVLVHDGTADPGCAAANGQTWSLQYAREHPLEHPHCSRVFVGIIPGREDETGR